MLDQRDVRPADYITVRRLALLLPALFVAACAAGRPQAAAPPTAATSIGPAPIGTSPATAVHPDLPPAIVPSGPVPAPWADAPMQVTATPAPPVAAVAAMVMDEASAAVLYDKDGHAPLPPASLTKIATAIVAIEDGGDLDATVHTDVDSRQMRGSTVMGLEPGDSFSLRDLLYGLILPSGNDAALAIGRYVAGSDQVFVDRLNAMLARLGLTEAHFTNPHGLGGGPDHVISAYDLALLSRYAMTLPFFRQVVSTTHWVAQGSRTIDLANVDTFLSSYPGADGVKTGYTRSAGRTLVASATRNGHRVYVVILNSSDRDNDARKLMNWAFTNFRWAGDAP